VSGVVLDQATSEPVASATVFVFGEDIETVSDAQGRFSLDVSSGPLSIAVVHPKFPTEALIDVHVSSKGIPPITVRLPHAEEVDDLVLLGKPIEGGAASILNERKKSSAVQDAIGSEDIAKSPDGSASAATRRIVGASIVGGQFLFVRGLGGRYSNVRLNGIPLPSTDPDLPGFQLDLFPTALLSALTITKTFTPDIPGDFAGGSLNVETRSFPEEFLFKLSATVNGDTMTTGREVLTYDGGATDYLGFDDGSRALPEDIPPQYITAPNLINPDAGFSDDELTAFGRSFPNRWSRTTQTAYPNLNLGLSLGDSIDTSAGKFGYFFTTGYRSRIRRDIEEFSTFVLKTENGEDSVERRDQLDREATRYEAQIGSLATISYAPTEKHEFSVVGLLTQSATDTTRRVTGTTDSEGAPIDHTQFSFVERQLLFGQVLGKHKELGNRLDLNWQLNAAGIKRDQPDTRNLLYISRETGAETAPTPEWFPALGSGERLYSTLKQTDLGGGIDARINIVGESFAKLGYMGRASERAFGVRRFKFIPTAGNTRLPADEIYSPEGAGEAWNLTEATANDDGFEATQTLHAGFAMAELQLLEPLRLIGGARYESFNQQIGIKTPFERWTELTDEQQAELDSKSADRTDTDWLPSAALVYALTEHMNLRAAYGGTVARPQLRELAPFRSQDFIRRRVIFGNPELERTFIHNFDLRWELFPSGTEVFAVSAFYKAFESPIESVITNGAGDLTFDNIRGATSYGAEFEARWSLGLLSDALGDFSAVANLALIQSNIRLTEEQAKIATTNNRPLAGQSPFIVNASVGYEPQGSPLSIFLYYNVFGRRIQDAGRLGLPDIYEEPIHALDLGVFFKPNEHWTLSLSAANLLLQAERYTQGGESFSRLKPALSGSLGASFTY
jgi:outer membrane receptor protein involved in Fe transport